MTGITELREAGEELQSKIRFLISAHERLAAAHERGEMDTIRKHLASIHHIESGYHAARNQFERLQTKHWVEKAHRPTNAHIE